MELSLQGKGILGIVKVYRKNTWNHQCKVNECSETTMYAEKVLGIVNARSMQGVRMLGIINARCEIARNRQCKE